MPPWLKQFLASAGRLLDRIGQAGERFMALMCLALVVPLTLVANTALIIWGQDGHVRARAFLDLDANAGIYLGTTASIAAALAIFSEFGRTSSAAQLAGLLDRATMPVAYIASALMVVFALLMWLR